MSTVVDINSASRWDRYGEILFLAQVTDRHTGRIWVVARRRRGKIAFAIRLEEWRSLPTSEPAAGASTPSVADLVG